MANLIYFLPAIRFTTYDRCASTLTNPEKRKLQIENQNHFLYYKLTATQINWFLG